MCISGQNNSRQRESQVQRRNKNLLGLFIRTIRRPVWLELSGQGKSRNVIREVRDTDHKGY